MPLVLVSFNCTTKPTELENETCIIPLSLSHLHKPLYFYHVFQVVDDNVFLRFHNRFHECYTGEEYDVEFKLNRYEI